MKDDAVRLLAEITRVYFRRRSAPGRAWLWKHWVRPYLIWRSLPFSARTTFGAKIAVSLPDVIQRYIYFFGLWEPAITAYVMAGLRAGDTFIDIGANIGYHSLLASHCVGPRGRVFAFEASPSTYALLQQNLEANAAANVVARNVAVTETRGDVPLFPGAETNIGKTTTIPEVAARNQGNFAVKVPGYPLGELVDAEALAQARFIKIDVEGAEWRVVQGMRPCLDTLSHVAEILIEIDARAATATGGSAAAILEAFEAAGFAAFTIENSYAVDAYLHPAPPVLRRYDGASFGMQDFVLKRG